MILILSTDGDLSTDEVIIYLMKKGIKFFRLNDNDIFKYEISFTLSKNKKDIPDFYIDTGDTILTSDEISTVWFRKFGFFENAPIYQEFKKVFGSPFLQQIMSEYIGTLNLICKCLEEKKWLANYKSTRPNKLFILNSAKALGIKVPESVVANSKYAIKKLFKEKIIAKSLTDSTFIKTDQKEILGMYTIGLSTLMKKMPDFFLHTLIQDEINKNYEIRTFFIDNNFFSMAIFSQRDPLTQTDFRKYNFERPNRYVPYKLDKDIEIKLNILLNNYNINTASIDLIYSRDSEILLLEINPCGQFGMISKSCNYPLEEIVANTLIKFDYENQKTF